MAGNGGALIWPQLVGFVRAKPRYQKFESISLQRRVRCELKKPGFFTAISASLSPGGCLLVPRLTFLRVHGDQALQSPSLHPVLSAWLGMIGNMAMGRWAVARRTRTATPRLKRSCCRPFHIRCNPATFSDSVATDPTKWRPDTRWTDPIFSRIRTGRVPVWAARGYGPMD